MPEAYTHIRIARAAAQQSGEKVAVRAAYEMGANGPDPLFAYRVLSRRRPWPLPQLGSRMHEEKCGAFLRALVFRAWTPAQRSYVMGFVTHYAADATLHPYVTAQTQPGEAFARAEGHGFCEVAMDSYFHEKDTGSPAVPPEDAAPGLYTADLAEVAELLHACIADVYGEDIPQEALADAFHGFRWLHGVFMAKGRAKRALVWVAERLVLHRPGWGLSHMTPAAQPAGGFAHAWKNPYTGAEVNAGPDALTEQAQELASCYIRAACAYWRGTFTKEQLAQALGDRSYTTGLLCEAGA